MSAKTHAVYQLKVVLKYISPPIWRRLTVSSSTTLTDLHKVIQIAMGWTNSHHHQFVAGGKRYGEPDPDFNDGTMEETGVTIGSLLISEKQSLLYEYDFGDGWEHSVTLEKIIPTDIPHYTPNCTDGRRGCPPEDVGGPPMYDDFLKAFNDPSHPEHQELLKWAGDLYDPEKCDIEEINEMMAQGPDKLFVDWD
jgi:hypothetical protein